MGLRDIEAALDSGWERALETVRGSTPSEVPHQLPRRHRCKTDPVGSALRPGCCASGAARGLLLFP